MEAFHKNIDALEIKTKAFIQKWKDVVNENQFLIERNRELEEKIAVNNSEKRTEITESTNSDINLLNIEEVLDGYVSRINVCLELINIELNGK